MKKKTRQNRENKLDCCVVVVVTRTRTRTLKNKNKNKVKRNNNIHTNNNKKQEREQEQEQEQQQEQEQEQEQERERDHTTDSRYRYQLEESLSIRGKWVSEMLEAQIIVLCESKWSSPVVLVAKPYSTQHVDYQALNKLTKRDLYPLPRCDDIVESLAGVQWFSPLDLLCLYWKIVVAGKHRGITASEIPDGLFRELICGLTNAPACFMRAMHLVLNGLRWSDCLVYLDDIIFCGRPLQEHRERLCLAAGH